MPTPPRRSPVRSPVPGGAWTRSRRPWVRKLAHVDRIVSLADALFDLEAGGVAADAGWLHDGPAHAWWVEPGRVLAGRVPRHRTGRRHQARHPRRRRGADLRRPHDPGRSARAVRGRAGRAGSCPRPRSASPALPDPGLRHHRPPRLRVDRRARPPRGGRGSARRTSTAGAASAAPAPSSGACSPRTGWTATSCSPRSPRSREGTRKAQRRSPESDEQVEVLRAWLARGS